MIKKIFVTAAVAALAVSFASAPSFAKGKKKAANKCVAGKMMTGPANAYGWGLVKSCGFDGKMYPLPTMCYVPSGVCPK
ncbi:MAG TPA: hypothetical protein VNR41_00805 [Xanthobacteraceae bacterium]|jgi:hypothetical protein|nr:hypothetical protein [Xanthobacteraceae bacterium]